jgi:hypothetical protein
MDSDHFAPFGHPFFVRLLIGRNDHRPICASSGALASWRPLIFVNSGRAHPSASMNMAIARRGQNIAKGGVLLVQARGYSIRPTATFTAATCNVRFTSTPDFAPDLDLCPLPAQSGLNASQRRLGFEPSSRRPIGWAPGPHGFRPRTSGAKPTAKMRAGGSNTIEFSTHFALVSLNFMHPDR